MLVLILGESPILLVTCALPEAIQKIRCFSQPIYAEMPTLKIALYYKNIDLLGALFMRAFLRNSLC